MLQARPTSSSFSKAAFFTAALTFETFKVLTYFTTLPLVSSILTKLYNNVFKDKPSFSLNVWSYFIFPIVGLTQAAILTGCYFILSQYTEIPTIYAALIVATSYPLLSGFIHQDGFVDTMDALHAQTKKSPKEVMDEPYIGAIGSSYTTFQFIFSSILIATVLISQDLNSFVTLTAILVASRAYTFYPSVFATNAVSKRGEVWNPSSTPHNVFNIRTQSIIKHHIAACAITLAVVLALDYKLAIAVSVGILVGHFYFFHRIHKHWGFFQGDMLGATICVIEAVALLIYVCLYTAPFLE